jgi:hypothetical protein
MNGKRCSEPIPARDGYRPSDRSRSLDERGERPSRVAICTLRDCAVLILDIDTASTS